MIILRKKFSMLGTLCPAAGIVEKKMDEVTGGKGVADVVTGNIGNNKTT